MSRIREIMKFYFKGRTMFKQLCLADLSKMYDLLHQEFVEGKKVKTRHGP